MRSLGFVVGPASGAPGRGPACEGSCDRRSPGSGRATRRSVRRLAGSGAAARSRAMPPGRHRGRRPPIRGSPRRSGRSVEGGRRRGGRTLAGHRRVPPQRRAGSGFVPLQPRLRGSLPSCPCRFRCRAHPRAFTPGVAVTRGLTRFTGGQTGGYGAHSALPRDSQSSKLRWYRRFESVRGRQTQTGSGEAKNGIASDRRRISPATRSFAVTSSTTIARRCRLRFPTGSRRPGRRRASRP